MTLYFGGKESVAILLLIYVSADILAIVYYRRKADTTLLKQLIPWAAIGIFLGLLVGQHISALFFKRFISGITILCLLLIVYREIRGDEPLKNSLPLLIITGVSAGFTSMIGNAAGPIMFIYFLSLQMPKMRLIGTTTWFFFLCNTTKLPIHIFYWKTMDGPIALTALMAVPVVLITFFIGLKLVHRIPERSFRYGIMAVTAIAAVKLLF
jgi:uncharacterized membrane protein YfcA